MEFKIIFFLENHKNNKHSERIFVNPCCHIFGLIYSKFFHFYSLSNSHQSWRRCATCAAGDAPASTWDGEVEQPVAVEVAANQSCA